MNLEQAIANKKREKLFVSLALRPGRTGTRFYTRLFLHHEIGAEYVACECTDIKKDIELAKQHCAGISITMPYKTQVTEFVDFWHDSKGITNTLHLQLGVVTAYNCDQSALRTCVNFSKSDMRINLLGMGAMSQNFRNIAPKDCIIRQFDRTNWMYRVQPCDMLVNATSIGMNPEESPVADVYNTQIVIDVVQGPTRLKSLARQAGKILVTGEQLYIEQFKQQFKVYTGTDPDSNVVETVAQEVFDYDY